MLCDSSAECSYLIAAQVVDVVAPDDRGVVQPIRLVEYDVIVFRLKVWPNGPAKETVQVLEIRIRAANAIRNNKNRMITFFSEGIIVKSPRLYNAFCRHRAAPIRFDSSMPS